METPKTQTSPLVSAFSVPQALRACWEALTFVINVKLSEINRIPQNNPSQQLRASHAEKKPSITLFVQLNSL